MNNTDIEPEFHGKHYREDSPQTMALDVAENILLLSELEDLLVEPRIVLTREDLNYPHNSVGDTIVRGAIAKLLSETWKLAGQYTLAADNVLCTPGATAALHAHAKVRLEPGDTVLVPAPYWQMFDRIYQELGISLVELPIAAGADTAVDLAALKEVFVKLQANGQRPKMLLLTNPHNPLGIVESQSAMQSVFTWVLEETEMDIVSDEIYAHSIYDANSQFTSALSLEVALAYPERVHVVWGLAKDFGLSGWMVGVLLTRCPELHQMITKKYARFAPFDGLKNRVMKRLFCERQGDKTALAMLQKLPGRMATAQKLVGQALAREGIAYATNAAGAPFFWLDLRSHLDDDMVHKPHPADCILDYPQRVGFDAREGRLQKYLACAGGLVLLRGQTMHAQEPGFFRLCFTAESSSEICSAIERMGAALRA